MDLSTNFDCQDNWVLLSSENSSLSFETVSLSGVDEEKESSSDDSVILETNDEKMIEAAQILCRMHDNQIIHAQMLLNIRNDSSIHERVYLIENDFKELQNLFFKHNMIRNCKINYAWNSMRNAYQEMKRSISKRLKDMD